MSQQNVSGVKAFTATEALARYRRVRLTDSSGVAVEYACFEGMLHPFFTLGGVIDDAARAEDMVASAVARLRPRCPPAPRAGS